MTKNKAKKAAKKSNVKETVSENQEIVMSDLNQDVDTNVANGVEDDDDTASIQDALESGDVEKVDDILEIKPSERTNNQPLSGPYTFYVAKNWQGAVALRGSEQAALDMFNAAYKTRCSNLKRANLLSAFEDPLKPFLKAAKALLNTGLSMYRGRNEEEIARELKAQADAEASAA